MKNSDTKNMDTLKQFVSLREKLQKEKVHLEARLAEINMALGEELASVVKAVAAADDYGQFLSDSSPPRARRASTRSEGKTRRSPRAKNSTSLRDAVLNATASKPLTAHEILDAVQDNGYKFTAKNPLNSLRTLLYSDNAFKNLGGKFGPA